MLYEMHIGLFTPEGTFEAAATRLEHLRSLKVTAVEIMPVGVSPERGGWGYDSALPEAVRSEFGGPMGLQRFVNACHAVGLGSYTTTSALKALPISTWHRIFTRR